MTSWTHADATAGLRYLLLADISGYTAFMTSVENAHGVDFSSGIPAGYAVLGALLDAVVQGAQPAFDVAKLEGDAVFAVAPAESLDGRGDVVLDRLMTMYRAFGARRAEAALAKDHICTACPVVGSLDLKMILHRGQVVSQQVGGQSELLGPAVNVAHRLLKNTVAPRIGYRPYLLLTSQAAEGLGVPDIGVEHREEYPDVGPVEARIVELGDQPG